MRTGLIIRRAVIFAAVATLAGTGLAAPASAAPDQCGSNRMCFWGENSYTGCFKQYAASLYHVVTLSGSWASCSAGITNGANSVRNEFSPYNERGVRLYDDSDAVGPYIRFDAVADGYNYQDPNLGNGGGVAAGGATPGQNWNNRISSFMRVSN